MNEGAVRPPLPAFNNFRVNSAIQAGALLLTWLMIRREFLFHRIPG